MLSGLSICIVGAGAAGCYTAQALRKTFPEAEITLIERLPVPFGLVRYGVAADHQGTKGVQQQFERMFADTGVAFVGGIELGKHLTLDQLKQVFDVVVLATGVSIDRRLGVEGDDMIGIVGAGRLTRALNSHPDEMVALPVIRPKVAIIGSGNVSLDVLRLLAKDRDEWDGSDMDGEILRGIVPEPVVEIHLISRSAPEGARWDAAMVHQLGQLRRPSFRLASGLVMPALSSSAKAVSDLLATDAERAQKLTIYLHFGSVVEKVSGKERVESVEILQTDGKRETIAVESVITAIGFEWSATKSTRALYTTGWLRSGPKGSIPNQRTLAKQVAAEIANDLKLGLITATRPGRIALQSGRTTDFSGWCRIDVAERSRAIGNRTRRKITDVNDMFAAAKGREMEFEA